jgi:hypothetical protein
VIFVSNSVVSLEDIAQRKQACPQIGPYYSAKNSFVRCRSEVFAKVQKWCTKKLEKLVFEIELSETLKSFHERVKFYAQAIESNRNCTR